MTDENNVYLKPCPFCGDSGFSIFKEGSIYVVQCGSCLCKTGATTEKDVIEYWNSRPIEEALEEENARLQRGLFDAIDQNQKNIYELSVQSARGANYALKEIKKIEDENKKLREALTFYAKGEHLGLEDWQTEQVLKDDEVFAESYCETGKVAREALKGGEK